MVWSAPAYEMLAKARSEAWVGVGVEARIKEEITHGEEITRNSNDSFVCCRCHVRCNSGIACKLESDMLPSSSGFLSQLLHGSCKSHITVGSRSPSYSRLVHSPMQTSCRELEAAEAEADAKKREERRRQERKNRDAFTALLRRHAAEGLITARMHFKVRQVGCRSAYAAVSVVLEGLSAAHRPVHSLMFIHINMTTATVMRPGANVWSQGRLR